MFEKIKILFLNSIQPPEGCEAFISELNQSKLIKQNKPLLSYSSEDSKEVSNCYIKSLLLHPRNTLWVGTAGGHLILIDTNTHQMVTVIKRYTSNVRAMVAVRGHGKFKNSYFQLLFLKTLGLIPQVTEIYLKMRC